ncbi:carbohydrate ABC transporter permease [Halobacterium sp. CBA1126]|uniref:carbohydrate ABC transporter permease n=1 Tax=Halobacterium TaxID=2239 RepID=UPI0012FACCF1|nr:sugar ABC transporter permease [Halobacterium sp. CBA1126]MUV59438.1 sugar ABC transporter permease [Halobacterium sp. CBA1126]
MEAYQNRWQAVALLLPTVIAVGAFFYWPLVRAVQLSRQKTIGFGARTIEYGWQHFTMLATSPDFQYAVGASFAYAISVVVISMVLGLLVSFLIYRIKTYQSAYLVAAIFTYALSFAVTATLWKTLFNPSVGIFTEALRNALSIIGIHLNLDYTTNASWAWIFAVSAGVWKLIGYNVIFMVAALGNIPETINETMQLDGVGILRKLVFVYVPMISPTLAFLAIINTANSFFLTYPIIEVLQGGPSNTLNILIYDIYTTFSDGLTGRASAKSIVLFVIVGGLTAIQLWISDKFAHYGGA